MCGSLVGCCIHELANKSIERKLYWLLCTWWWPKLLLHVVRSKTLRSYYFLWYNFLSRACRMRIGSPQQLDCVWYDGWVCSNGDSRESCWWRSVMGGAAEDLSSYHADRQRVPRRSPPATSSLPVHALLPRPRPRHRVVPLPTLRARADVQPAPRLSPAVAQPRQDDNAAGADARGVVHVRDERHDVVPQELADPRPDALLLQRNAPPPCRPHDGLDVGHSAQLQFRKGELRHLLAVGEHHQSARRRPCPAVCRLRHRHALPHPVHTRHLRQPTHHREEGQLGHAAARDGHREAGVAWGRLAGDAVLRSQLSTRVPERPSSEARRHGTHLRPDDRRLYGDELRWRHEHALWLGIWTATGTHTCMLQVWSCVKAMQSTR